MPISTTATSCSGVEAQKLQGQAEAVVQIALGLEDVELCAQRRSHGFLGRGLSRRAGNGNHAACPTGGAHAQPAIAGRGADLRR